VSNLRLSVLDQSPIAAGFSAAHAIQNSISLAKHVETLGFTRFWMSEHHAMGLLACTSPEILLARIGAETSRIRIGSGGIMLPHYSAFKVAETFRTLHALYPNRIDLGLGRAPGGGPVESLALQRDRKARPVDDFADQVNELLAWFRSNQPEDIAATLPGDSFPANHPFSRTLVSPLAPGSPDVWMLGSSLWGSAAAASLGLPYAFAHFFSPVNTRAAIENYQRGFLPSHPTAARQTPEATIAVGAIVADTAEEADYLHASVRLLQARIRTGDRRPLAAPGEALRELQILGSDISLEEGEWPRYFVGTPTKVADGLRQMAQALNLKELVVNTIIEDHPTRLRSYTLLANEFNLREAAQD
jgi:luciferase family oxidoreductase group 1